MRCLESLPQRAHHKNTCRDLHQIIKSFNKNADFQVQGYADVQQVYNKTFKPCEQAIVILKWMIDVTLQLNPRKTLIMVINTFKRNANMWYHSSRQYFLSSLV